jgi:hypothetical protein
LDSALFQWFTAHRASNIPISGPILLEKANEFAQKLNEVPKKGTVSESWIVRFRERHGISFQCVSGEAGAVDAGSVGEWIQNVWPTISAGYSPDDIFNADEFGLFYKLLPDKTLSVKGKLPIKSQYVCLILQCGCLGEKCTGGK